jgi:hypothetical protein
LKALLGLRAGFLPGIVLPFGFNVFLIKDWPSLTIQRCIAKVMIVDGNEIYGLPVSINGSGGTAAAGGAFW